MHRLAKISGHFAWTVQRMVWFQCSMRFGFGSCNMCLFIGHAAAVPGDEVHLASLQHRWMLP